MSEYAGVRTSKLSLKGEKKKKKKKDKKRKHEDDSDADDGPSGNAKRDITDTDAHGMH